MPISKLYGSTLMDLATAVRPFTSAQVTRR
jgi:hypothetical protein